MPFYLHVSNFVDLREKQVYNTIVRDNRGRIDIPEKTEKAKSERFAFSAFYFRSLKYDIYSTPDGSLKRYS